MTEGLPYGGRAASPRMPRPRSVSLAIVLLWVFVAVTVLGVLPALTDLDALTAEVLEADTTGDLTETTARRSVIVFVVMFALAVSGFYAFATIFIARARNWARIVYTVLSIAFVLIGIANLGVDKTPLELALDVLRMLLTAATVVLLYRRESNAFFASR